MWKTRWSDVDIWAYSSQGSFIAIAQTDRQTDIEYDTQCRLEYVTKQVIKLWDEKEEKLLNSSTAIIDVHYALQM